MLLVTSLGAGAAPAEWLVLENPYFRAFASTNERRARELMEELDQFRVAVQIVTDLKIPKDARRTDVLILGADFGDLTASRAIAGFAMSTDRDDQGRIGTLIVMPANKIGASERVVIRHEYVHVLNRFRPLRYPTWYEEGTAEVFAYTTVRDGNIVVIDVPSARIRNFKRGASAGIDTWISFDKIVGEDKRRHGGFQDTYLQYWLLAHYLIFGNPALAPELEKSLIYYDAGMRPLEAFTKAFGETPESLWNAELERYRRNIGSTRYTLTKVIAGEPFTVRPDIDGEGNAATEALRNRLDESGGIP